MPVIQDQELLYTLLSEGRLDLMYLPAGAIAWLWKDDRPEEQVDAATQLGIAAKDVNPITDASVLKSDKNILILKCEDGQTFRVYPGGGYSRGGKEMMDLNGCIEAMQNIPEGEMQNPEPDMPCDTADSVIDVVAVPEDGFDHMASPMPPEEVISGGPANMEQLLQRATDIEMDEEYGDQPRLGQYYTYDELANETARDIQAHSGEDMNDIDCDSNMEGQEFCDDGGLPHNHDYEDDTDRYSVTSESFDFSLDQKKKLTKRFGHLPSYIYEETNVGNLSTFNPGDNGGFWINGFTNKAVMNPGASHVEMVRQKPEAFGVTGEGMPIGDLKDIWQSDEYEAWMDATDEQTGSLKLGIFGTGWVRGSADYNDFVGFTGTIPALQKVKTFIVNLIKKYQPHKVYIDIMDGNTMETKKINMGEGGLDDVMAAVSGKELPTTENAGGAAANSAPIGTDMFDTEDDIAGGVMMQFEDESD